MQLGGAALSKIHKLSQKLLTSLEVVTSFLRGRDVFAVLPTGFGKSLCYACLPAAFDKILEKEKGHSCSSSHSSAGHHS